MAADRMRLMELSLQGFGCSQLLVLLDLETAGRTNPELVRAVSGLHGGLGYSGKTCGALAGGCCVLALHAGRGAPGEVEDVQLNPRIRRLVEWFEAEVGARYGGIDCAVIAGPGQREKLARCPEIVAVVHDKVQELLALGEE
jgi:hypothetical protein